MSTIHSIEPVVTEFSNLTVPTSSIVLFMVVIAVLLLSLIVAIVLPAKKAGKRILMPMVIGALSFAILGRLLYMGTVVLLRIVPGVNEWMMENSGLYAGMIAGWGALTELMTIYFGMAIAYKLVAKNEEPSMAVPVGVAVGIYLIVVVLSDGLNYIYFVMNSLNVNSAGFDTIVAQLMHQSNYSLKEAVNYLKEFVTQEPMPHFLNGMMLFLKLFVTLTSAVIFYAVKRARLGKLWGFVAVILIAAAGTAYNLFQSLLDPRWVYFSIVSVAAVASIVLLIVIAKKVMPDEWTRYKELRENDPTSNVGKRKIPQKLPKIVMPKD